MGLASARFVTQLLSSLLLLEIISCQEPPAWTSPRLHEVQSNSSAIKAAPVGTPTTTIIEFGDAYLGGIELYDVRIAVLDVVRGPKAWEMIENASASNPHPKPGLEYVLARVRFELSARNSPALYTYHVDETQFAAIAPDGQEFPPPELTAVPEPRVRETLKSGDSLEGWLVFLVPLRVSRPLMVFREDVGTVSHRGSSTWFQLYTRSGSGASAKP